ncbi:circadian clock protein KaiC [Cupriavidus gilardii J11]|uniref:non-specific serine/threonine protein kinase n=1 Tax=Cupriavidus gilardii J11 TaxID=936133 RepID=A0A562BAB2_9BURK|nr:ATPase domain-containing protein [Cupriavidus gilardii]TWG81850.1 circadian clock protein KaiC [Cupriavidus gilardii J11]
MTKKLVRVQSEIPGLDTVLCGGLVQGASYIVQGSPGSGKTILANQLAFSHARRGQKVLYVTLLAESHDWLFQSLSTLDFYDASRVGVDLFYISLFQTLRDEGLSALVAMLRRELLRHRCSMLVLDGLLIAKDRAQTTLDVKTFVAELQGHAAFTGCTVLFLTSASVEDAGPEHTMVDGVLQLREELSGNRSVRQLRVSKSRGSGAHGGYHQYDISARGITVYPRLEKVYARPTVPLAMPQARAPSGVAGFDELIGGGLPQASVTLLLGPSGSGKTTFGLNFLRLASEAEPALHFGFYESPDRLLAKAKALDIDIEGLVAAGHLQLMWQPLTENLVDQLGHALLDAVSARGVKRLFIDGFGGFQRAALEPGRLVEFLTALSNELRARGVTTVVTAELRQLMGPSVTDPLPEMSSLMDNMVMLRQTEMESEIQRLLAVVKIRDSGFDPSIHVTTIGPGGLSIHKRASRAEGLLTGTARHVAGTGPSSERT